MFHSEPGLKPSRLKSRANKEIETPVDEIEGNRHVPKSTCQYPLTLKTRQLMGALLDRLQIWYCSSVMPAVCEG